MRTASRTLRLSGRSLSPKLENESIATTGSRLKCRATVAAIRAISASCRLSGLKFTVVSAKM